MSTLCYSCFFLNMFQGTQYLVKWANYHKQESTWEPSSHLPTELTSAFLTPDVNLIRLQHAAENFELAIQQRLCSRQSRVVVNFELDVYKHVFHSDKSVLINGPDDLRNLPVCESWHFKLNKYGKGVRVSFPMRIKPRLYNKFVFNRKHGEIVKYSLPVEKLVVICAIEPFV